MQRSSSLPGISAKKSRHDAGISRYKDFEQGKLNKNTLNEMMKGERDEITVPKTGEFLVIASDKKAEKNKISDIPILDLLDVSNPFKFTQTPLFKTTKSFKDLRGRNADSQSRIQTPLQAFVGQRPVSRRIKLDYNPVSGQQQRLFSSKTAKTQSIGNDMEDLLDEKLSIYQDVQQDRHPIEDVEGQQQQPQIKLTKNIKIIMKKQQSNMLSPSAKVMHHMVEEKLISDSESRPNSRLQSASKANRLRSSGSASVLRPVSAQFVLDSMAERPQTATISEEMKKARTRSASKKEFVVKKSSYSVQKKYTGRPDHIMGFQTISDKDLNLKTKVEVAEEEAKEQQKKVAETNKVSPYLTGVGDSVKKYIYPGRKEEPNKLLQVDEKPTSFLPLEYYFVEEDYTPEELLDKYRDEETNKVYAYSKWFKTDGTFEWKRCEVECFDQEKDFYKIIWRDTKATKYVSRVNLKFEREDENVFLAKIARAEEYRSLSETFLKYNHMIETMDTPTHQLTTEIKDRIIYFVLGFTMNITGVRDPIEWRKIEPNIRYNAKWYLVPKILSAVSTKDHVQIFKTKNYSIDLLNTLVKEIERHFVFANHKIQFNNTLPYSEERQMMFRGVLPEEHFIPIFERKVPEEQLRPMIDVGYDSPGTFVNTIFKMRKILHQANVDKLKILIDLNKDVVTTFESASFFMERFPEALELPAFIKSQKGKMTDLVRDFKGRMFDSYYDINNMVEAELENMRKRNEERMKTVIIEAERKAQEEKEIPFEIADMLRRFQSLLNSIYERTIRMALERSMIKLDTQYEMCIKRFYEKTGINPTEKPLSKVDYEDLYAYQQEIEYERPITTLPLIRSTLKEGKSKELRFKPSMKEIEAGLYSLIVDLKSSLLDIECLKGKEIGWARKNSVLHIILEQDEFLTEYFERVKDKVSELMYLPKVLMRKLHEFNYIVDMNVESLKKKLKRMNFAELKQELHKLKASKDDFERVLYANHIQTGILLIDCSEVRTMLDERIKELWTAFKDVLIQKINQENTGVEDDVKEISEKLKRKPENLEELFDLRDYCNNLDEDLKANIGTKITEIMNKLHLLEDVQYKIGFEDFAQSWASFGMPSKLLRKRDKCLARLKILEKEYSDKLMVQQNELALEISEIKLELEELMLRGDYEQYNDLAVKFGQLGERIDQAQYEAVVVNRREGLVKWKESDYQEVEKLRQAWIPYHKLWTLASNFHLNEPMHRTGALINIDRDQITKEINEAWNDLYKMEKGVFKLVPHMLAVVKTVKENYEGFKPYLPIINDLRNPDLQLRHFKKLQEVTGITELEPELNVGLDTLEKKGLMDFKDQISEISEIASKEKGFERLLTKMRNDWRLVKFELGEYRNTGVSILRQLDPILDQLDNDLTRVMSMSTSPFVKFLENDVSGMKNQLIRAQDIIEIWTKVQKLWQYLQPIFFSEDIIRQMAKEGAKFSQADKAWRGIMESVVKNPNVMDVCNQTKLKENFQTILDLLEQVVRGLNDHLNTKRQAFPRFYFLSNDELISILAQTKEPKAVQRHLNKCFEGIEYLTFRPEDLMILEMNSAENETVPFSKPVNPIDDKGEIRFVEEWLADVEKAMKETLKDVYFQSLADFAQKKRKDWLFSWPSQIVTVCDLTLWTSSVNDAIIALDTNQNALKEAFTHQNDLLLEVVDLLGGNVSKRHIMTLGVLIVLEVHAKDVIEDLLKADVKNINAFEWLAQMRFYVEKNKKGNPILNIHMLNTFREYGFEYLGNQTRLVITPLTDRCYRTLMSALQMNLGGAPEGPAGTGKTETTKDLAKALAKHCMVFNCSDAIDYEDMAKFFKGLCSCGSWACFDEFNRIELEVLSVIAQQILTIQNALIREANRDHKTFMFEGTTIPLDSSCAVFITMNPGYAGRSELPDNLKALFRPVAMMIPNYSMIAEISLYSYGFKEARELSIKITTSLKLASEQLSSQSHYDFGMRAVKSIILAAGALKRAYPKENESLLTLRAISDCNLPKFTTADVPLFKDIISDLFPTVKVEEPEYGFLQQGIQEACEQQKLILEPQYHTKIFELYETIQVRHGLMLVGAAMSGKSSLFNVLASGIERASILKKQDTLRREEEAKREIEERKALEGNPAEGDADNNKPPSEGQEVEEKKANGPHEPSTEAPSVKSEASTPTNRKDGGLKVRIFALNPKSVTSQLLYGAKDNASGEWRDGITANIFRESIDDRSQNLKWILFDGPVDALWIENMNTVLDDNKKLCLPNGETIKLREQMSIIFEVEDLAVASPATVSRCGMVYLEPENISWQSYYTRWKNTLPSIYHIPDYVNVFDDLLHQMLEPALSFLYNKCKMQLAAHKTWVISLFLRVFESYLLKEKTRTQIEQEIDNENQKLEAKLASMKLQGKEVTMDQLKKTVQLQAKDRTEIFALFTMALTWSFGAIIMPDSQPKFSAFVKELQKTASDPQLALSISDVGKEAIIPEDCSIFEVNFDFEKRQWGLWTKGLEAYKLPQEIQFHEVYIPTVESIRSTLVLQQILLHNFAVLFIGKTGTGKTMTVKRLMLNDLDPGKFIPTITVFSANTTSDDSQNILESKLEKQKRRKGVYGPIVGFTNIIFIDDLNMPTKEKYGAQPPLELVRQWFDYKGWYDRKTLECKTIADIQFVAAMGVGRPPISNRLLRHFNTIYLPEMSEDTLKQIVTKMLDWGFAKYIDKVKFSIKNLTELCLKVYKQVQTSKDFLPLPSKSHYLFNLRDLMKVVQGLLSVPHNKYDISGDVRGQLLRLWTHESICVYSDRLVDEDDKAKFLNLLSNAIQEEYMVPLSEIVSDPSDILFGNYIDTSSNEKIYEEILDNEKLRHIIEKQIEDFNTVNRTNKIDIVLFRDAIQMLSKINRIISQPYGNALLVGVGGSGRHTLSRLAAHMQEYQLMELEIEKELTQLEWYEFLRKWLRVVGVEDKKVVFLMSDTQISDDKYYEDINNLLNIGEIPNLFAGEDKENLISDLKERLEKEKSKEKRNLSPLALWELFVNNCRINLHIVLCVSPIGDKLRNRLRNFPSLVSCTSVLWILPWSDEALTAVASHFLSQAEKMELTPERRSSIANICVRFHSSVRAASKRFQQQLGRYYYVTPISYMQLLSNLENLLTRKQKEMLAKIEKYSNGVMKLQECGRIVDVKKLELEELKPNLVVMTKQTEEIMAEVEIETAEAEKQRAIIQEDEKITKEKAQQAATIEESCKERLSEAEPELERAIKALDTLKRSDFDEMRALQKPPIPIRKTMEAVVIMLGKYFTKPDDFWEEAKKQLNDAKKLMNKLKTFDRNNIPDKVHDRMTAFLKATPDFVPEKIRKASVAAEGLCCWVRAIYNYNIVNKQIQPLRDALKDAQQKSQEAQDELEKKQKLLQEVLQRCEDLNQRFEKANYQKQSLKAQITNCEIQLERATKLTSGLGAEQERWTNEAKRLTADVEKLLGDVLLATGAISYLGAFNGRFRTSIIRDDWMPKIIEEGIQCNENFSLIDCIGNQMELQDWTVLGLPLDDTSKENAIIMKESSLWPLLIDPQKQAFKFISRREKSKYEDDKNAQTKAMIEKPGKNIGRILENVVRNGSTLLVENLGEVLDPVFDSVLRKNTYLSGGVKMINIGASQVQYNEDFRLYLFSNLNNPHYTPEVLTKVTLLNFTITAEGLKDQLLSRICQIEESKEEEDKKKLTIENIALQVRKQELENRILELLKSSGENMLNDVTLVNSLTESKVTTEEIEVKLKTAKFMEDRINGIRALYEPIAFRASSLYLIIIQLAQLDPMYQFSLEWFFETVYVRGIHLAEKPHTGKNYRQERIGLIQEALLKQCYREVNRSIYDKHKLLFSLMMGVSTIQAEEKFDQAEWNLLLTGLSGKPLPAVENPDPETFSAAQWESILHLSNLDFFSNLSELLRNDLETWKNYIGNIESEPIPEPYQEIQPLQRLLLVKTLRIDLFTSGVKRFISEVLGEFFIMPQIFTLEDSFKDSKPEVPLIFLLSPGDDPQDELKKFAQDMSRVLVMVSLGKGQGEIARKQIMDSINAGAWILLQNCHLAASWLKTLEEIVEQIPQERKNKLLNENFRLWLTAMSTDAFPVSLLQNGIKMTKDPPRGVKTNMLQAYKNYSATKSDREWFNSSEKPEEWKKLFMGLCYFHALIRERKRFGAVGWNIKYDFNDSDFKISMRQLYQMLNKYPEVPFEFLIYLTSECYYGGRVTDDWDRRLITTMLKDFYNPYVLLYEDYKFSPIEEFCIPDNMTLENAQDFLDNITVSEKPELFGLHSNAQITSNIEEASLILNSLLLVSPKTGSGSGENKNQALINLAKEILSSIPQSFDLSEVMKKYPITYYESMNTVLLQELGRFNNLIVLITGSLKRLISALEGIAVFTADLEKMAESLTKNVIPQIWLERSYPSLKSLSGYIRDFQQRLKTMSDWIDNGIPKAFWISAFYFPQSFLTGILQNHARKHKIPIDQLRFSFQVTSEDMNVSTPPENGCYIYGLFLEGATWNAEQGILDESTPRVLYKQMPIIWLVPTEEKTDYDKIPEIYTCPTYKTLDRRGTLSTTGHSTNFIIAIQLPHNQTKEHWVKRGVAMFTHLND